MLWTPNISCYVCSGELSVCTSGSRWLLVLVKCVLESQFYQDAFGDSLLCTFWLMFSLYVNILKMIYLRFYKLSGFLFCTQCSWILEGHFLFFILLTLRSMWKDKTSGRILLGRWLGDLMKVGELGKKEVQMGRKSAYPFILSAEEEQCLPNNSCSSACGVLVGRWLRKLLKWTGQKSLLIGTGPAFCVE